MIIIRFFRYLAGYVTFTLFGGFFERFLNMAAHSGVHLWDVTVSNGVLRASTRCKNYKRLRRAVKKSGGRMRIEKKRGLPFFLFRYRKRKGLAVGLAVFFLILWAMSLFVWSVEVEGCNDELAQKIVEDLDELGVRSGVFRGSINVNQVESRLLLMQQELSLVAISIKGTNVQVQVSIRTPPPQMLDEATPCNMIALKDGFIVRMEVHNGQPVVKKGDAVVKGDLLVSGIATSAQKENLFLHAAGKVIAQTHTVIEVNVPFAQQERVLFGKPKKLYTLRLFDFSIPLSVTWGLKGDFDTKTEKRDLSIGSLRLPVSVITKTLSHYNMEDRTLTQEEAREKATAELEERKATELSALTILSSDVKETIDDKGLTIRADYVCEENIAGEQEIFLKNTDK